MPYRTVYGEDLRWGRNANRVHAIWALKTEENIVRILRTGGSRARRFPNFDCMRISGLNYGN